MTDEEILLWLEDHGWEANEIELENGREGWAWTHESDDATFTVKGHWTEDPPISDELREYVEAQ